MVRRSLVAVLVLLLAAGCGVELPSPEPPGVEVLGVPATIGRWEATLLLPDPDRSPDPVEVEDALDVYLSAGGSAADGAWAVYRLTAGDEPSLLLTVYRVIGASQVEMWNGAFAAGYRDLAPVDARPGGWELRSDAVNPGWVAVRGDRLVRIDAGSDGPTIEQVVEVLAALP